MKTSIEYGNNVIHEFLNAVNFNMKSGIAIWLDGSQGY